MSQKFVGAGAEAAGAALRLLYGFEYQQEGHFAGSVGAGVGLEHRKAFA